MCPPTDTSNRVLTWFISLAPTNPGFLAEMPHAVMVLLTKWSDVGGLSMIDTTGIKNLMLNLVSLGRSIYNISQRESGSPNHLINSRNNSNSNSRRRRRRTINIPTINKLLPLQATPPLDLISIKKHRLPLQTLRRQHRLLTPVVPKK